MRIRHLSVRNFRGIRELDWCIGNVRLACLVGPGDSTKSTVLEAIRRLFYPQWNLTFDDSDFHQCDPASPITITAIVGDLPESFLDLGRYGYKLIGWNPAELKSSVDPGEGLEDALRVRLSVSADLEPKWLVIKDEADDGVPFSYADRARASVGYIGVAADRHLSWSRGSILHSLMGGAGSSAPLADAHRVARAALDSKRTTDLKHFDDVASKAEATARSVGVHVGYGYKAHIDSDSMNVRAGGLSLHDGAVPLRSLGLGSRRVLTTGLQAALLDEPHITLLDEVELGLEPHRIARLLRQLTRDERGQYFLTTHSPVVIRELSVTELFVTRSAAGVSGVVAAALPGLAESIQGKLRLHAEAFLASRILVCEGATEVGFVRGLETAYWGHKESFAYQGLALLDAQGASKVRQLAAELKELGFSVAVLADADAPGQFSAEDASKLRGLGVSVHMWSDNLCLEQRAFSDLPWSAVVASVQLAIELRGGGHVVIDNVRSKLEGPLDPDCSSWAESADLRAAIGRAAKDCEWFKRIDRGQRWSELLAGSLSSAEMQSTPIVSSFAKLRDWIDSAEPR